MACDNHDRNMFNNSSSNVIKIENKKEYAKPSLSSRGKSNTQLLSNRMTLECNGMAQMVLLELGVAVLLLVYYGDIYCMLQLLLFHVIYTAIGGLQFEKNRLHNTLAITVFFLLADDIR